MFTPANEWCEMDLIWCCIHCITRQVDYTAWLDNATVSNCVICQCVADIHCKWKAVMHLQNTQHLTMSVYNAQGLQTERLKTAEMARSCCAKAPNWSTELPQTDAGKDNKPLAVFQRGCSTYLQALSGTPKMKELKAPKFSIAMGWKMWSDDKLWYFSAFRSVVIYATSHARCCSVDIRYCYYYCYYYYYCY